MPRADHKPASANGEQRREAPPRRERLAVNINDIHRLPDLVRDAMRLPERLSERHIITDRSKIDEAAVELTCSLLTAACLLDFIRERDREHGVHPTRVYSRRAVAWVKLPGDAVLSVVEGDRVKLNPALFPEEVRPVVVPPPVRRTGALL